MADTLKQLRTDWPDMYNNYRDGWRNWLPEAQTDLEMYLDAQFSSQEHAWANRQGRSLLVFNKMKRQVKLLHGYEIRNRHVLKIGPIGREDDEACRQHTGVIMQLMAGDGYDILSDAFKWGPLVSGSNLLEIWRDRSGDLKFNRRGHNSFVLDPMLTKPDLSDCQGILTGAWIAKDKIKSLLPTSADRISKVKPIQGTYRWKYMPGKPGRDKDDTVRLYEEWWRQKTTYETTIIDRLTGHQVPFDQFVSRIMRGDRRRANWFVENWTLRGGMPALSKYEKPQKEIRLSIFVDGEPVWDGENPLGLDDYNFVWLAGEWVPECDRDELKLQGFVRTLRDPQKARNKRMNQILDLIESQLQGWRAVRQGHLVDIEDAYSSGQGKVIQILKNSEKPFDEVFRQYPAPDIPPGLFNMLEVLDKDEMQAGGMNEEIMGSDDKDIPGILHSYRTGAALTGQQGIFSGYRRAKRQLGQKLVRLVQEHYGPGKVYRLLNEQPAQGFYEPDFVKYDCNPTEGLLTDSQRHLWYLELKGLRAQFPDAAQAIPLSMLVKDMPIQFPRELLEAIQKSEQMQSQLMQAQLQSKQAMDNMMMAQAAEDIADAEESRAGAVLDRAKAMTELRNIPKELFLQLMDRLIKLEQVVMSGRNAQSKAK